MAVDESSTGGSRGVVLSRQARLIPIHLVSSDLISHDPLRRTAYLVGVGCQWPDPGGGQGERGCENAIEATPSV